MDPQDPALLKKLDRLERDQLIADYAGQSSRRNQPLTQSAVTGTLDEVLNAPSGKRYGVITLDQPAEREKAFSLIPWRDHLRQSLGKTVSYGLSKDNIPFVKPLTRTMGLQR